MRMPARDCERINCLRMLRSTGMDCDAHSMWRLPDAASAGSRCSCGAGAAALLAMIGALRVQLTFGGRGQTSILADGVGLVGGFPGKFRFFAAEMAVSGSLLINGTNQVQHFD